MPSTISNIRLLTTLPIGVLTLALCCGVSAAQDTGCGEVGGAEKPSFNSIWQGAYPASQSMNHVLYGTGDECQLCHESSGGGDGYNSYGWALRTEMDAGASISSALNLVEAIDSDADATTTTNLHEITSGTQPGWASGPNNTIFYKSGVTLTGKLPPSGLLGPMDPLSFPTTFHNGTGVNASILTDTGGDPSASPEVGSSAEAFQVSLDCSSALSNSFYSVLIQASLKAVPVKRRFGQVLCNNPLYASFAGLHTRNQVTVGPVPVPYDISLVGFQYYVQGFCGDPAARGFVSNALGQRMGI